MPNHEAPISGQAAASGFLNLSDGCTELPAQAEVGPGKLVAGEAAVPPNLQFFHLRQRNCLLEAGAAERKRSIKVVSSGSIPRRPGKAHIFLKFVVALLNNPTRQMVLNEENSRRQTMRQHGERES